MNGLIHREKLIIGISIGDIHGIGMEVIIKSLNDSRILKLFTPVIYGSTKVISFYQKVIGHENFNFQQVKSIEEIISKKVNVINVWNEAIEITPGRAKESGGRYAMLSLKKAVEDLKAGRIHAIVTAPLTKELIWKNDAFHFIDHTDYLAKEANAHDSLMFMIYEQLRVGVVTGHISVKEISSAITREKVSSKLGIMMASLKKDFGIRKPRIAVLGLNPHAGEKGMFGEEELDIIVPVIKQFTHERHLVLGPFPADGFFGTLQYRRFDGVLAMYHDQGLIPFKCLAFKEGVNYTAGLPFVRTSPIHGTALAIAGKNEADPTSFRNALYLANDIVRMKSNHKFDKEIK